MKIKIVKATPLKLNFYKCLLLVGIGSLSSCGGGSSSGSSSNSVPFASDVIISVTGAPVVGSTLMGNYIYNDEDNDEEGVSLFSWVRGTTAISGANSNTYLVSVDDSGQDISFLVTPVASVGEGIGIPITAAAVTIQNSIPIANTVSITDDNGDAAIVGDSLSASYSYVDLDNDTEGNTLFSWLRAGVAITGATSSSYQLIALDEGQAISVQITPVASSGSLTGSPTISSAVTVDTSPTASNVLITDDNSGDSEIGDSITATYTFTDSDGDSEGATIFTWLSDGVPISGATNTSYVLTNTDVPSSITFEVTPISNLANSLSGTTAISNILLTGTSPVVSGFSRLIDVDGSDSINVADQLIIPFDQDINLNGATTADLTLPVTNSSFGSNASMAVGPTSHEITVTLGTAPSIKSRQNFSALLTTSNAASGVDISASISADLIEGVTGKDAIASTPIDIVASFRDTGQLIGFFSSEQGKAIASGDFDKDGDIDFVMANRDTNNGIYMNDGSGHFSSTGHVDSTPSSTYNVVVGDIDRDGDLDYVTANKSGQANRVYLNDGSGIFTDSGQTIGSSSSNDLKLFDGDNDGDLDLIIVSQTVGTQYFTNDGSGVFLDSGQSFVGNAQSTLAIGDIDSDGDIDVIIDSAVSGKIKLTNSGSGVFASSSIPGIAIGTFIELADLDGDGDLDIIDVLDSDLNSRVYLNDGSGAFTRTQTFSFALTGTVKALNIADIDSDGDMDLVITREDAAVVNKVFINDGNAQFSDTNLDSNTMPRAETVALADINGDGDMDIIQTTRHHGLTFYENTLSASWGSATFSRTIPTLAAGAQGTLELDDIDNDGDLDLLVKQGTGVAVYTNNGEGQYTDTNQNLLASFIAHIKAADIDNDGDTDLIITETSGLFQNRIFTNDGSGVFTQSQVLANNNGKVTAVGDIDGDGDLDIVIGNYNSPNTVWINNAGVFTDSGQLLGSERTFDLAFGDMDKDGDLDLVVANDSDNSRLYLNDGAGVFTQSAQTNLASDTRTLALGDLDNDGDLDVLLGRRDDTALALINDGTGSLTNAAGFNLGGTDMRATDVKLADVDGDGDLDLLVALTDYTLELSEDPNMLYFNDGSGNFSAGNSEIIGLASQLEYSSDLQLGDIDNDGDIDAVFGHGNSPTVTIHLNQ